MNTAAGYLSRLEFNPHWRVHLKFQKDNKTQAIEVNIDSLVIVEDDQVFFMPHKTREFEEIWKMNVTNKIKTQQNEILKIKINATTRLQQTHSSSQLAIRSIKKDSIIRVEQDKDNILKNKLQKIGGQLCD